MLHDTTTAAEKRTAFRAGLASGKLLRFPGAFNPQQIARVTALPALVDADTGFGEPLNAARTVQLLEDAGVAGLHIEDQVNPKRCGHLDGKDVTDRDTAIRRIKAAVAARRDPSFVIAARTDAAAVHGIAGAIDRAKAYADAGADLIFPEAMAGEADFERFRAAVDVPILANMTEFGKSRLLDAKTLQNLGVNIVIYPVTLLRLAMHAAEAGLTAIAAHGTQEGLLGQLQHRRDLYDLLGYEAYNTFDNWHGELPAPDQLAAQNRAERAQRALDPAVAAVLAGLPPTAHPMDTLRTAVSLLGAGDRADNDNSPAAVQGKALRLFALLPTVVAMDQRRRHGLGAVSPRGDLGFSANFLYMTFGEVPEPQIVAAFEASLILYAEHSFNASTFTARVVASTLSDLYSAVTAAIGALKGPLHGGANEAVMDMLDQIAIPDNAGPWLVEALANKRKIMGFGHRVYKNGDSRVPIMQAALEQIAAIRGGDQLLDTYETLAQAMYDTKGLHPNLDYPAGPAYHLIGFDTPSFTPVFVVARITGWTAHIAEQLAANSLIRPLAALRRPRRTPRERRPAIRIADAPPR